MLFVLHALGMSASHVLAPVDMYISSIYCVQARSITNNCCGIGRNMYNKLLFCDMFSEFLDSCLCSFHRYLCVRETSSPGPYGLRGL